MCNVLQLSRATYYYEAKQAQHTGDELSPLVKKSSERAVRTMEHEK